MGLVRIYLAIVRIAIALALLGELRACTVQVMHLAADKTEHGWVSYSKFTRALTSGGSGRGGDQ
jgi:hypothetical protein